MAIFNAFAPSGGGGGGGAKIIAGTHTDSGTNISGFYYYRVLQFTGLEYEPSAYVVIAEGNAQADGATTAVAVRKDSSGLYRYSPYVGPIDSSRAFLGSAKGTSSYLSEAYSNGTLTLTLTYSSYIFWTYDTYYLIY